MKKTTKENLHDEKQDEKCNFIEIDVDKFVEEYGQIPMKSSGDKYLDLMAKRKGYAILDSNIAQTIGVKTTPTFQNLIEQNNSKKKKEEEEQVPQVREVRKVKESPLEKMITAQEKDFDTDNLNTQPITVDENLIPLYQNRENKNSFYNLNPRKIYPNINLSYRPSQSPIIGQINYLNLVEREGRRSGLRYYSKNYF